MRITLNVADVARLHPMLCHQPELISDSSIAYGSAPWFPSLPPFRFKQRISGQRQTYRKSELDWLVQKIFLKLVNNPVFHFVYRLNLITTPPYQSECADQPVH